MSVVIFPGQGTQFKGMGKDLFPQFPDLVNTANSVLGYSIEELCLFDPNNQLNNTQYTQPALYTVNALNYLTYLKSNPSPSYVAGHSLGEYNALLAAEVFDFDTGLKLVVERGRLMSSAKMGSMLAVLGCKVCELKEALSNSELTGIDVANYNTPQQIVLSGAVNDIKIAHQVLEKNQITCIPLTVSGAFHSRYMLDAASQFGDFLKKFSFSRPRFPVVANVSARPYQDEKIISTMVSQLSESVRWSDSIQYLIAQNESDFIELGQSNVLSNMVNEIKKYSQPEDIEKLKEFNSRSADVFDGIGSLEFKQDYQTIYPYVVGSMGNGISSISLVKKLANAGIVSYFGSANLSMKSLVIAIEKLAELITSKTSYGINILFEPCNVAKHQQLIEICLENNVSNIEISGFDEVTETLVEFRLCGLSLRQNHISRNNKILLKTSSSSVASEFLKCPPKHLVESLLAKGKISSQQAQLSESVSMVDDICMEGSGGWQASHVATLILLPELIQLRDAELARLRLSHHVRIGCSGGIGTPQAMSAMFNIGADFILTGSINQCTVEADISDRVKDVLATIQPQDTCQVPAGQQFESGAKEQVVRKHSFFPARAQKLYDLYRLHGGYYEIDEGTRAQLENHFFRRSYQSIVSELKNAASLYGINNLEAFESDKKYQMEQVFKWYFRQALRLAIKGDEKAANNFKIYSGPAMGALNKWLDGTGLENWRKRNIDVLTLFLLNQTADLINKRSIKAA